MGSSIRRTKHHHKPRCPEKLTPSHLTPLWIPQMFLLFLASSDLIANLCTQEIVLVLELAGWQVNKTRTTHRRGFSRRVPNTKRHIAILLRVSCDDHEIRVSISSSPSNHFVSFQVTPFPQKLARSRTHRRSIKHLYPPHRK